MHFGCGTWKIIGLLICILLSFFLTCLGPSVFCFLFSFFFNWLKLSVCFFFFLSFFFYLHFHDLKLLFSSVSLTSFTCHHTFKNDCTKCEETCRWNIQSCQNSYSPFTLAQNFAQAPLWAGWCLQSFTQAPLWAGWYLHTKLHPGSPMNRVISTLKASPRFPIEQGDI